MRRSLILFSAILALFLIFDRIVGIILHHKEITINTGQGVGKVNTFLEYKDCVEVVLLGSSRAAHHINPEMVSTTLFNMGMDGTRIAYAAALANMLNDNVRILIIHIDPEEAYNPDYSGDDAIRLLYKSEYNKELSGFFKKYYPTDWVLTKISKSNAFNGLAFPILKNLVFGGESYSERRGFEPLFPSKLQTEMFANMLRKDSILTENKIDDSVTNQMNENFVLFTAELARIAKKNNSKLIFFTSPTLNQGGNLKAKKLYDFLRSMDISYFDDRHFFKDFNVEYWKDQTHLSAKGADAYTMHFEEILKHLSL